MRRLRIVHAPFVDWKGIGAAFHVEPGEHYVCACLGLHFAEAPEMLRLHFVVVV
jgi:hypothetical protein